MSVRYNERHEKEVQVKQGLVINAAIQWHLQGMKLLPKSPLDSSHLEGDTERRRGHFRKVRRQVVSKEYKRGGGKERTCNQSSHSMAPAGHEVTAEELARQ